MTAKYSIGEFAKRTGTTIRTLHYYDEISLLKPALTTDSGRRFYSDDDLVKLQKIVSLKYLGYSLEKISEFIHLQDWSLKDSLSFQKKEMLQKKQQLENVIRALDHALLMMDSHGKVDSSIFISLIKNIQMEDEHKEWLKGFIHEEKVEKLYSIPEEKQLEMNIKTLEIFSELKELYGQDPASKDVQELIKDYMGIVNELTGDDLKLVQDLYDSGIDIEDEPSLFHSPFTAEEENWLAKAIEIYIKKMGIVMDKKA
ncbi:MerR family transcriptional regulator [Bacillus sp. S/N-304-OC-R1]|uniref:MerR family transcriptional regulator n=1 Tax=Bacillus sp. S/N-304-OC-R1 TaxID=2758034 RepID=UPI001C8D32D5|nr:MerR family transcriptional regulator [Bacillus sp. S/N-304-OC-R1]MBY0123382.1 MerR family transcriptional regulator [Bacillus sp. S/N-304-OC-R1]